jgi:hypothetical protein
MRVRKPRLVRTMRKSTHSRTRSISIQFSETPFPSPDSPHSPAEIRSIQPHQQRAGAPLPQRPPPAAGQRERLPRTAPRRRGSTRSSTAGSCSSTPSRCHSASSPLRRPPLMLSTTTRRRSCCSQIPSPPHQATPSRASAIHGSGWTARHCPALHASLLAWTTGASAAVDSLAPLPALTGVALLWLRARSERAFGKINRCVASRAGLDWKLDWTVTSS